ncbi:MAG: ABC transporter substrate-binding protein [Treponema sp.]|jgi:NitT/TauT family transport system substrate-binding protein|nr:ABC transporter substrate-binding protein [Treponema sp.]
MENLFKKIVALSVIGLVSLSCWAKGSNDSSRGGAGAATSEVSENLVIYGLRGPSGVGMIRLFEYPPAIPGTSVTLEALAQADLMVAKFVSGEAKIGILPPNVAAKIASTGKKLQIAAVTGTGMISLISGESAVRRIEDLKGRSIGVAGQGATPDYVFRKILLNKGLNPDTDVTLDFSLAYPEIAQSLIAGRISLALLPEPFATMARSGNPNLQVIGNIEDEWVAAGGSGNFPMTVLVVDADYAASRPQVISGVLADLKTSIEWVVANPAEAGVLVEKHDLGLRAPVVAAAVPRSNYVFISAMAAKPALESLYRAFLEFAPQSIGGALPPDSFYWK